MKQNKTRTIKVIVTVCALLILLISGGLITKTPLKERGIVIGMGLDKKDDKILLLAQIILGGENSTPGSASAFDVLEGTGNTLSDAFADLAKKATLVPSYAHCNILFVGKKLLEDGFDEIAKSLVNYNTIKDNTQVVVADDAKEAISTLVPLSSTPSEYMEKEIKLTAENGGRSVVSLKDFAQREKITSGSRYLTYAKMIKANAPTGENTSKADKIVHLFDLSNTAVFDLDGNVKYYDKTVTEGIGLVEATGGSITCYQNDKYLTVDLLKSVKLRSYRKDPHKVISNYTYYARISEQTIKETNDEIDLSEAEKLVEKTIAEKISLSYNQSKKDNVDLFSLIARLYKRYGEKYDLNDIEWEVNVNVIIR